MRFLRFAFPMTVIQGQSVCPDQRLNAKCESICVENFSFCMESCSDNGSVRLPVPRGWKAFSVDSYETLFLAVNQSATANTSAALNIVLAMKNVQLVASTVIVQFVEKFLSLIHSGKG